jgi:hypothetical protein
MSTRIGRVRTKSEASIVVREEENADPAFGTPTRNPKVCRRIAEIPDAPAAWYEHAFDVSLATREFRDDELGRLFREGRVGAVVGDDGVDSIERMCETDAVEFDPRPHFADDAHREAFEANLALARAIERPTDLLHVGAGVEAFARRCEFEPDLSAIVEELAGEFSRGNGDVTEAAASWVATCEACGKRRYAIAACCGRSTCERCFKRERSAPCPDCASTCGCAHEARTGRRIAARASRRRWGKGLA